MPSAGLKAPSASRKFPTEYKLIVSRYQQQRSNAGRLAGLRWQESRVGHPCLLPSGKVASLRLLTSPYCNEGAGGHTKGRMRRLDSFPQLLHAYFYDWMARQRNASRHTVLSYRDAWRLFLRFVAQRCQKEVAKVALSDLTPTAILAFLDRLEKDRNATIATRNCRLAALHSFFTFLADREPLATAQCDAVLRIPVKRGPKRSLQYLEEDEVKAILSQPDQKTLRGQRDYTLLSLLYNTGARISEILELTPGAIRLEPPAYIKIIGRAGRNGLLPYGRRRLISCRRY